MKYLAVLCLTLVDACQFSKPVPLTFPSALWATCTLLIHSFYAYGNQDWQPRTLTSVALGSFKGSSFGIVYKVVIAYVGLFWYVTKPGLILGHNLCTFILVIQNPKRNKTSFPLIMGWIVSLQKSYVEALTPRTSECDCTWRQGL